ncbi:MAG: hypothetical protein PVJ39_01790 [Gammaproteobacteria bacterium]|jgi:hypothetical protein
MLILTLVITVLLPLAGSAADKKDRYRLETKNIKIGMFPRTPSQMAAFYEGRGFPENAINETRKRCFITVGMRNTGKQIIWLNLASWRFYNRHGEIQRTSRDQWKQTWQKLGVPLASQSTFNWTLLPEQRDLHPDEPAGGNITLEPVDEPFDVKATFATGKDKSGKPLVVEMKNVRCLKDSDLEKSEKAS